VRPEWIIGKRVLEAGCGNPRNVIYFNAMGAELAAGCDISEAVIRRGLASEWAYALDRRVPNARPVVFVADCENLPVSDGSLDTILIFQAAHHLDIDRFIAEARRALVPGGVLFISDPNGAHPLRRLADSVGRASRVMSDDESSLAPAMLAEKLRLSGFDIVESRAVNLFSELFFLFTTLVEKRSVISADVLRLLFLPPLSALDALLEISVFKALPSLSWRHVIAARKK
jgi:SAM-dependent methyltransferase